MDIENCFIKKILLPEKNGIFFDQSVSIEFRCEGIVKKKNEKKIFTAVILYIFDIHRYMSILYKKL